MLLVILLGWEWCGGVVVWCWVGGPLVFALDAASRLSISIYGLHLRHLVVVVAGPGLEHASWTPGEPRPLLAAHPWRRAGLLAWLALPRLARRLTWIWTTGH